MSELPNGGWVSWDLLLLYRVNISVLLHVTVTHSLSQVAPNIYFMGFASVIKFAGLRICGLSGIFKGHDFDRGWIVRE